MTVEQLIEILLTVENMGSEVLVNDFETIIDVRNEGFVFISSAEDK